MSTAMRAAATHAQRTMSWRLYGATFLIAHSSKEPTDADYDDALRGYQTHLGHFDGILISSLGGGPNFAQRKRTTEFWRGKSMPRTVVMTSSPLTRGIITAMNWFLTESPILATSFADYETALRHLGVSPARGSDVETAVNELHGGLGD